MVAHTDVLQQRRIYDLYFEEHMMDYFSSIIAESFSVVIDMTLDITSISVEARLY